MCVVISSAVFTHIYIGPCFIVHRFKIWISIIVYNLSWDFNLLCCRGKFGTVYKCREKSTGLQLAAKFVSTSRKEDKRNVEREIDIMRSLQHPRLIQLYDAFEKDKTMVVILELWVLFVNCRTFPEPIFRIFRLDRTIFCSPVAFFFSLYKRLKSIYIWLKMYCCMFLFAASS